VSRIEEIDSEIGKLKDELLNVEGNTCEVYTRIVGYYRSIKNFNAGKADEYTSRKTFVTTKEECDERAI